MNSDQTSGSEQGCEDSLFLRALRLEATERTPVWLMRQAGRYQESYRKVREKVDFLSLCHNSQLAAQVTVQAVDELGVDAGIIFADILLPLECMGSGLRFARGDGPVLDNPVRSVGDVERLQEFDVEEGLGYVFQSVRNFIAERPTVPLIGFAGAPFTLASYLIEGGSSRHFDKTKAFMYCQPEAFEKLMALLTTMTIAYLQGQKQAGAHCLMLFDSWVGALGRHDFARHVLPHSRRIIKALSGPTIYFGTSCGGMLDLMSEAGSTALGVDWRSDMAAAWSAIGQDRAVMGNLDPCVLLAGREEIADQVDLILQQTGARPGHIFNLGHGILQNTSQENVRFLVDTVKERSQALRLEGRTIGMKR